MLIKSIEQDFIDKVSAKVRVLPDGRDRFRVFTPFRFSELSKKLGQKKASGRLYNVMRDLLTDRMIEYTLPEKPRSRRQQYRLTSKGKTALANLTSGDAV